MMAAKPRSCELADGKTYELKESAFLRGRSGKYVITAASTALSALDYTRADIYELNPDGLKHIKNLGDKVSVSMGAVGVE